MLIGNHSDVVVASAASDFGPETAEGLEMNQT